ncbi:hypothetical protein R3W88_010710 [Solanum pinnatisectum]|uniref:Uncharacterized protein n=1 Tax=Solanum pinnatisectum TaxID=50273 RepID=A0AAV9L829_9SOLN|nr:hypothetical protein R3W88_010710 [Solanum pinnatisectum]
MGDFMIHCGWNSCMESMPWARRDEYVTSEMVVKTLMDSTEGFEMRKRAADMSKAIKTSVMDGGMNRTKMISFTTHITRLKSDLLLTII